MTEQLTLVAVPPKLTDRQQLVLDAVTATGRHGLEASDAGFLLYPDAKPADRIFYGNQILRRLRDLGLVRYRRAGRGTAGTWLYDGDIAKSSYQDEMPRGMTTEIPY